MNWRLTQNAIGEPEIDYRTPEDEDLALGYSLLRALAEHDRTMIEVSPGVWRVSKPEPGREV